MPSGANAPGTAIALAQAFKTLGRLPLQLDETIVPVAIVADLRTSIEEIEGGEGGGGGADLADILTVLEAILVAIDGP